MEKDIQHPFNNLCLIELRFIAITILTSDLTYPAADRFFYCGNCLASYCIDLSNGTGSSFTNR